VPNPSTHVIGLSSPDTAGLGFSDEPPKWDTSILKDGVNVLVFLDHFRILYFEKTVGVFARSSFKER
jgi:hypothetical protein